MVEYCKEKLYRITSRTKVYEGQFELDYPDGSLCFWIVDDIEIPDGDYLTFDPNEVAIEEIMDLRNA